MRWAALPLCRTSQELRAASACWRDLNAALLADSGFAERATKLSSFDARGAVAPTQFGRPDTGLVGASKEMELRNARGKSSVSDPASASAEMTPLKRASDGNVQKRKAPGRAKARTAPCPPPLLR
ncbi:hypothetical protein GUJ93_ZPchr0005g15026 [Zizania palustris]|uniref:Uncharacterized protein n=1 Tax=Zizania palustris TaxID=103762 RepID=A0A8J5S4L9_ZIZPA|nr:hypothetical protein GUJ93_ZPchr0005g15026 [Zizania palustris]